MRNRHFHEKNKTPASILKNRRGLGVFAILLILAPSAFSAISYPYALPDQLNATLKVDTGSKSNFNNLLLGLNTNFPENQYGSDGYNDTDGQDLITTWNPPALRFPHGVWANFYDWEVDGRRIYDGYDGIYVGAVTNVPNLRYGFPGFNTLHSNLNFDVLFTWNVNYDSPAKGVARLQDRIAKGFDVSYIELGNEHFWLNQCSEAVDTAPEYVAVAQAHSAALKAEDPSIKISVPVSWRDFGYHTTYNNALIADMTYYDAVSLHKYLRTDGNAATDVQDTLKSRHYMIETGEYINSLFPGKPIWLSEWSVKVDTNGQNAVSVLGMTEVYLGIMNRPDLFERAEYFQIHNHDPMVVYDKTGSPKHTKTSIGAAYDILRGVFEDSEVYASTLNSSSIEETLDAVSAEAVIKGNDVIVFAVNKTTNSVPLDLKFDDILYTGSFSHETFSFNDVNDFPSFNLADDALTIVSPVNGGIMLPPLSLSKISGITPGGPSAVSGEVIFEAESARFQTAFSPYTVSNELDGTSYIITSNGTPTVNFNSVAESTGMAAYDFVLTQNGGDLLIEARVDLVDSNSDSFWHRLDGGPWIKQDGFSGGGWRWFTLNNYTNLSGGRHTLEIARRDRAKIDQFRLSASNTDIIQPDLKIEAEEAFGQSLFSPFTVNSMDEVTYIEVPSNSVNFNSVAEPDGRAVYEFRLSETADILLEARVDFPSVSSDSFWHRMDGGSWTKQNGDNGDGWRWLTLGLYTNMAPGVHQLEIARREAGSRIDAFNLTASAGEFLGLDTYADAGGNQAVPDTDADGVEWITLNGSSSLPADGLSLTSYIWKRGSEQIASGITTNVMLPLGTHMVTLLVSDSVGTTAVDTVSITVDPATGSAMSTNLLAGFEQWSSTHAGSASLTSSTAASYTDVGASINSDAASTDGSFGTLVSPAADITNESHGDGTRMNNGASATYEFTITDTSGTAKDLTTFHFDTATFRPQSARGWTLSVLSGDITSGVVASGTNAHVAGGVADWEDYDLDLTGLADNTLDANGTVIFELAFIPVSTGGTAGHHQYLDNVGISSVSGGSAYPDADGNGLPDWWETLYLGGTGQVATVDSDLDGLSNGDELIAGTDPGEFSSAFVVHYFEEELGGGYTVKWDSNSDRIYHVMKGSVLTSNDWNSISGPLPGTGGEISFNDPAPAGTNVFYKLQVTKP
ncbi:hypothetical protein P4B35_05490 [Pontiellaceae bacterium B12227]|nr:hypothetical protein [Pontiellaceae bacterium B12227]